MQLCQWIEKEWEMFVFLLTVNISKKSIYTAVVYEFIPSYYTIEHFAWILHLIIRLMIKSFGVCI